MESSCLGKPCLVAVVLGALAACGANTPVGVVASVPLATEERQPMWSYHPTEPAGLLAGIDLGNTQWLLVGKQGERWVSDVRNATAMAAPMLADQDLVAVIREDEGRFTFVGAEGGFYASQGPLGPLTLVRRMDSKPMRIAAAGRTVVAVLTDGRVVHSKDGGTTFSDVAIRGSRPYDVAVASDERAMILGFPEQLWVADARGDWRLAGAGHVGVRSVNVDRSDTLVARGVWSSIAWEIGKPMPALATRDFAYPLLDLMARLEQGPDADALVAGRAAVFDGMYHEVDQPEEGEPWRLGSGSLAGRLRWKPVPNSDACAHMVVAVHGNRWALGCLTTGRKGTAVFPPLHLFLSDDGGSTFVRLPTQLVGDEVALSLAVDDGEAMVVSGVCEPGARGICVPGPPVQLRVGRESGSLRLASIETSQVKGFSGQAGRVLAAHGRFYSVGWSATGDPFVLLSEDHGKTFVASAIDLSATDVAKDGVARGYLYPSLLGTLVAGDEGRLSWVLQGKDGLVWVVVDQAGKVVSARRAPSTHPILAAAGMRAMAVGAADRTVLVSNDGGRKFEPLTRLRAIDAKETSFPLWCGADGCVLGDAFSRVGWTDSQGGVTGWPVTEEPKAAPTIIRTPIVCDVIESARGTIDNVIDMPNVAFAMRGKLAWSASMMDRANATVATVHATDHPVHAVRTEVMLGPVSDPTSHALQVRRQAEGSAAMRFRFVLGPNREAQIGTPMRIEVAWDNQFEGPIRRGVITERETIRPNDVRPLQGQAAEANNAMLSISHGGIYVCPHHGCQTTEEQSFFLRNQGGIERIPPIRSLASMRYTGAPPRWEWTRLEETNVPFAFLGTFQAVTWADPRPDGAYDMTVLSIVPPAIGDYGLTQATLWAAMAAKEDALLSTLYRRDGSDARAWIVPIGVPPGSRPIIEAPTQKDLSDPPTACTAAQRETHRVLSPTLPGAQHPVVVRRGKQELQLVTGEALLHGTASAACVAVYDARLRNQDPAPSEREPVSRSTGNSASPGAPPVRLSGAVGRASSSAGGAVPMEVVALLPVGSLDKSWLLERSPTTLHWSGMRCAFQPVGPSAK